MAVDGADAGHVGRPSRYEEAVLGLLRENRMLETPERRLRVGTGGHDGDPVLGALSGGVRPRPRPRTTVRAQPRHLSSRNAARSG